MLPGALRDVNTRDANATDRREPPCPHTVSPIRRTRSARFRDEHKPCLPAKQGTNGGRDIYPIEHPQWPAAPGFTFGPSVHEAFMGSRARFAPPFQRERSVEWWRYLSTLLISFSLSSSRHFTAARAGSLYTA